VSKTHTKYCLFNIFTYNICVFYTIYTIYHLPCTTCTREEGEEEEKKKKKKDPKVHPDLVAMTYLGTGKMVGFSAELSAAIPGDMMASYNENRAIKFVKTKREAWIAHNREHLRYVG
jgi:hypothetical protein